MKKQKATIYVKHGNRLLVFTHVDFPEAGIQVPSGTVEAGETSQDAARRELAEESGLDLPLADFRPLGTFELARAVRDYFLVELRSAVAETWVHWEEHSSSGKPPIALAYQWMDLEPGLSEKLASEFGQALHLIR